MNSSQQPGEGLIEGTLALDSNGVGPSDLCVCGTVARSCRQYAMVGARGRKCIARDPCGKLDTHLHYGVFCVDSLSLMVGPLGRLQSDSNPC